MESPWIKFRTIIKSPFVKIKKRLFKKQKVSKKSSNCNVFRKYSCSWSLSHWARAVSFRFFTYIYSIYRYVYTIFSLAFARLHIGLLSLYWTPRSNFQKRTQGDIGAAVAHSFVPISPLPFPVSPFFLSTLLHTHISQGRKKISMHHQSNRNTN